MRQKTQAQADSLRAAKKTPNEIAPQIFLRTRFLIVILVTVSCYAYSAFSAKPVLSALIYNALSNEQFRANLLRAISCDLHTPLTSILGNAGVRQKQAKPVGDDGPCLPCTHHIAVSGILKTRTKLGSGFLSDRVRKRAQTVPRMRLSPPMRLGRATAVRAASNIQSVVFQGKTSERISEKTDTFSNFSAILKACVKLSWE